MQITQIKDSLEGNILKSALHPLSYKEVQAYMKTINKDR